MSTKTASSAVDNAQQHQQPTIKTYYANFDLRLRGSQVPPALTTTTGAGDSEHRVDLGAAAETANMETRDGSRARESVRDGENGGAPLLRTQSPGQGSGLGPPSPFIQDFLVGAEVGCVG